LSRDGIPTPTGGKNWSHQALTGGGGNTKGIIGNRIYIGELDWNAYHAIKNPDTGKRTRRKNDPDDVIRRALPHLQIVDQDLWERANAIRDKRGETRGKGRAYGIAFRNVFERFVVHPTDKRMYCEVTPYARVSAITGINLFPTVRTPEEMLAEQGLANTLLVSTGAR
jgi:Recombinase